MKQDTQLSLRLSTDLFEWYTEQAEELGITTSELIRSVLAKNRHNQPMAERFLADALEKGFSLLEKHPELLEEWMDDGSDLPDKPANERRRACDTEMTDVTSEQVEEQH